MAWPIVNDPDYLVTRLHGRRSRLAQAERLDELCRLARLPELTRALYPETEFPGIESFQHRLAQDLVHELAGFLKHLEGKGADLLTCILSRFQLQNIKVLLRGALSRTPWKTLAEHLLTLPKALALDEPALAAADSPETFTQGLPVGPLRRGLGHALTVYRDQPRPFFLEGALDRAYFQELLACGERISGEEGQLIQPILLQEADAFQLMLAVRGKFLYDLKPELVRPLHVPRSSISTDRFSAMLTASDILDAATLGVGRAIDFLPPGLGSGEASATLAPSTLEALAWKRFLHLSTRAFRGSYAGLAALVGYVGIRRVELANLITLSEGKALQVSAEVLRARLIPRANGEPAYV